MFALVLTGPPGAGKTAVLEALSDALVRRRRPPRHGRGRGADLGASAARRRAVAGARARRSAGCTGGSATSCCSSPSPSRATLTCAALLAAIGADEHVVVRLHAEPATLRQRIIEREPDAFTELDELVAAAARLSPVIAGLDGIALALSTEGERPAAVAERIRDAWPAKLRPRAEPEGRRAVDSAPAPRDTGADGDGQRRAGAVELRRVPARRLERARRGHGSRAWSGCGTSPATGTATTAARCWPRCSSASARASSPA